MSHTSLNSLDNRLKITIRQNGVSYVVFDENRKILLRQDINVSTENDGNELIDFFFNQPELKVFDENVNILFDNSTYTLFPKELFRIEDYKTIFEIEHGEVQKGIYIYQQIEKWDLYFVFRISEKIKYFFEEKYPEAEIKHSVLEFLKHSVERKDAVYVRFDEGLTTISLVKNNKLYLTTSFDTPTVEDASYFVLSTYEEFGLSRENYPLKIIHTPHQSGLFTVLNRYVVEIEVVKE